MKSLPKAGAETVSFPHLYHKSVLLSDFFLQLARSNMYELKHKAN